MATKAKGKKNGDVISALKAFETTLRAVCRHSSVPVYRPLLDQLQQHQDQSQPLTAVVVSASTHPEVVAAVADCLASYPATKSLSCLGCCVGDKGLAAISALLQASGSKWWHGCRLTSLEISNVTQPSTCRPASATALVDPAAVSLSTAVTPSGQGNIYGIQRDPMRPATAPQSSSTSQSRLSAGICPALPGYLRPDSPQRAQDDLRLSTLQLREVHYKVKSPKTMMEIRTWALAPTLGTEWRSHQHAGNGAPSSPTTPGSPSSSINGPPRQVSCSFSPAALQQLSLALRVTGLELQRLVLDHTSLGDQGTAILAVGLGACSTLKVLNLRYCGIGPAGAQALAEALVPACKQRIASSSSSSSAPTAAGSAGSRISMSSLNPQLASAAEAAGAPPAASNLKSSSTAAPSGSSSGASSGSREPQLSELRLDGNPLGVVGLHSVSKAVRLMSSVKVITLADVSVDCQTPQAALEVQVLAHSLLAGPNELCTLDFTDNHISDECAAYFIGLLKGKPSITLLKLTPRLSPSTVQQLSALLEEHQKAARAARTSKKKKQSK